MLIQDASLRTTSFTGEMTLPTRSWRQVRLVLIFVPQRRVDYSGRLTPRQRDAMSKAQTLGEKHDKIEFLGTENVVAVAMVAEELGCRSAKLTVGIHVEEKVVSVSTSVDTKATAAERALTIVLFWLLNGLLRYATLVSTLANLTVQTHSRTGLHPLNTTTIQDTGWPTMANLELAGQVLLRPSQKRNSSGFCMTVETASAWRARNPTRDPTFIGIIGSLVYGGVGIISSMKTPICGGRGRLIPSLIPQMDQMKTFNIESFVTRAIVVV